MSEHIQIETEPTGDPTAILLHTNLRLAEQGTESYDSREAMEEGSAVAQALAPIEGLAGVTIEASDLEIKRDLDVPWHQIITEITDALTDFFL